MGAIVYQATNLINGKRYIGVTSKTLAERKRAHAGGPKREHRGALWAAIRKYGAEMIRFRALTFCETVAEALAEERRLIAALRPEYNWTLGGEGSWGHAVGPEARRKIGDTHRGKPGYWLGKRRAPETTAKIRAAILKNPRRYWLGKKRDPEMVSRMAKTQRDNGHYAKLSALYSKPLRCIDDGRAFASLGEAARHYGVAKGQISMVCTGKAKTAAGHRFEYLASP